MIYNDNFDTNKINYIITHDIDPINPDRFFIHNFTLPFIILF
jgi:hypothetical protein